MSISQSSPFKYHKFIWQNSSLSDKRMLTDDNGRKVRLYKREYDYQGACFYMCDYVFPTMYIYSCGFIGQLYDYCQNLKKKYKKKSIAAAFANCPTIYMLIKYGRFDSCHLEDLSLGGETQKCLAVCYPSFVCSKKWMYNRLVTIEESLKAEIPLIKTYELKGKWDTAKKIGAGALKVAARVGVALVAGAVGGNLDIDLPDFDFGSALPDVDFDFDFDIIPDVNVDVDMDGIPDVIDSSLALNADATPDVDLTQIQTEGSGINLPSGDNISFGSQHETLSSVGGIKLDAVIDKEPGTSNKFCITTNKGVVHNVSGGTSTVKINGIVYKLPKLIG